MPSLTDPLVQQLLQGRYIASIATENPKGLLHMVAVWYVCDGTNIFVATSSQSRKAKNLASSPKVALMIDSRDPAASFGVTIAGTAQLLRGDESQRRNKEIHCKYLSSAALADTRVGPVFAAWDDVTIQINPQSIITWDMREADRQAFGGSFASNPGYLLPLQR
jgi:nitroimidazol reductase NimA-like FMN-containing flavoprotein (pyridoxamine 5'-phosphate oxidase superfamily)